jgi:hypothetical protein
VIAEEAVVDSGVGIEGYVRSEISLTIGSTYQVQFDLNLISGKMQLEQWAGDTYKEYNTPAVYAGETVIITITNTGVEKILWGKHNDPGPFVFELDNVSVKELTPGPIDTYRWDNATDYSSGGEPLGIFNGERVYKSVNTHADGSGGTTKWVLFTKNNDTRVIGREATNGAVPTIWFAAGSGPYIDDYLSLLDATGTATVTIAGSLLEPFKYITHLK